MGWHITLKQPFIPKVKVEFIEEVISNVCKITEPFYVSLTKIGKGIHLQRPSLYSEGKNNIPHISLTWGVKKEKVESLKSSACKLSFKFLVRELFLLKTIDNQESYCWQKFQLGKSQNENQHRDV